MATLLDSLVSYWKLDSAGITADAHGSNTLTNNGTTGTTTGKINEAGSFNGSSKYLSIADNTSLSANGTSLVISCWVNFTSKPANQMDIVSKFETTGNQREYRLYWDNTADRLRFEISTSGSSGAGHVLTVNADNYGAITTGQWIHVIGWFDVERQTANIQVFGATGSSVPNAAFITNVANGTSIKDGTSPLHIGALGRSSVTFYFNGAIDEVALWKGRVLTPAERTWLNNSGSGRDYSALNTEVTPDTLNGTLFNDGIWTWFNEKPAIYFDGKFIIGAYPSTAKETKVAQYVVADGAATTLTLGPTRSANDDHNNPGLLHSTLSEKVLACWADHPGNSYAALSTSANDATAFDSTVTVSTGLNDAYAQLCQATYNHTVYQFFRRGTSNPPQYFRTSTDDGATWSSVTSWLSIAAEWPYVVWHQTSGTRFDCFLSDTHPNVGNGSIYHVYLEVDASTGARTWRQSDGTAIGTGDSELPLTDSDLTLVYDGSTSKSWIWDGLVISGEPVCYFVVYPSHSSTTFEYHRGVYSGGSWTTEKVADCGTTATSDYLYLGETYYAGGICGDPTDKDICYLSREYGSGEFRLHKFDRSGGSWAASTWLSEGWPGVHARPIAVSDGSQTHVFWWNGAYRSYSDYRTVVMAHPAPQAAAVTSGEQRGPVFSSVFSPVNPPLELLHALGLA